MHRHFGARSSEVCAPIKSDLYELDDFAGVLAPASAATCVEVRGVELS